jgi:hypothetical protein
VPITPVVYTGQAIPGGFGGSFAVPPPNFGSPNRILDVASNGTIAFQATQLGSLADSGVWTWTRATGLTPVVVSGQSRPSGGTFSRFTDGLGINAAGQLAIPADGGLYFAAPRAGGGFSFSTIAAPGSGGIEYVSDWGSVFLNDAGQVLFAASVTPTLPDGSDDQGYFLGKPGQLQTLLRTQMTQPLGYRAGGLILRGLDASGRAHFAALGPEIEHGNGYVGVGGPTAGDVKQIAPPTQTAPGTSAVFGSVNAFPNRNGRFVFEAGLQGFPGDGIWSGSADNVGSLTAIVLRLQTAPGVGLPFLGLGLGETVNDHGDVLFSASVGPESGPRKDGIWFAHAGTLKKVIVEGDFAANPKVHASFAPPLLNNIGQVAFIGDRFKLASFPERGGGDTLWAGTPENVQIIATSGDALDLGGTTKTIDELFLSDSRDLRFADALDDAGDLVFQAKFTDGTYAILVAELPEPAGGAIIVFGAYFSCRRRNARRRCVVVTPAR